jgi:hypothetical protein
MLMNSKKKFPKGAFKPKQGCLEQRIFENTSIGVPLCLIHCISFGIEPFKVEGQKVSTFVELGFITLPVKTWKEIGGRTFEFPANPAEGYIDGSISLFGVHNPVDATQIRFGAFNGRLIPATITLSIDFTF